MSIRRHSIGYAALLGTERSKGEWNFEDTLPQALQTITERIYAGELGKVGTNEMLSRFVFSRHLLRADGTLKPDLFIPYKHVELSETRPAFVPH